MAYNIIASSVAAAGTEKRVTTTDPTLCSEAIIQNTHSTGLLYIGNSTVDSTHGLIIQPGKSLTLGVGNRMNEHNLYDVWLDSDTAGCTYVVFYREL